MTPFTILTGWLGAGKTTALNRMLAAPHGKRIAVLVNELGRISIDTQLIVGRGGDVLELAGGCVCCKVDIKNDLWDGIADIVARSWPDSRGAGDDGDRGAGGDPREPGRDGAARRGRFDQRRSGGAEQQGGTARDRIAPAGVICVVDAETGADALAAREEAGAQVMSADRVLLAKLDVAPGDAVRRTHARLDELAPHAERAAFPDGDAGGLALTAWILESRKLRAWSRGPHVHDGEAHHHGGQLIAVTLVDDAPLVGERVLAVIDQLGARLVRAKGFVHVAGDDRKGFVERAGVRTSLSSREPWGDEPRRTELVLIGDGLDEAALRRALWACRAASVTRT